MLHLHRHRNLIGTLGTRTSQSSHVIVASFADKLALCMQLDERRVIVCRSRRVQEAAGDRRLAHLLGAELHREIAR
ncbi:hypothetical protein GUITHDRAFT_154870 [Guillardia theta CCMP2712]|uniref:Uncharacterized protein n=1 Tax=Guillardia theta (strain CCMP2712) TaxID=905079 RepID=L1IN94_GUITC|nr:hypothetical protein GUITHDRAFT_154870 [Guillardia theta CCMP2712]EKX37738.1 hypothetical protein GUITHDRAFT_154870 [Guillardia theta CCMP2712]|eukprot:XP_005824718.1 hypothetical protein GUITHDRAFT_154870 [Guillardia theta CCMP2712]